MAIATFLCQGTEATITQRWYNEVAIEAESWTTLEETQQIRFLQRQVSC